MSEILVNGIARYVHAFTPSAPPNTDAGLKYSIEVLVHKSDTAQIQRVQQAIDTEKAITFPNGMSPRGVLCMDDLATDPRNDPRLQEYMAISFSTEASQGQPPVVDMNRQPLINPNQLQAGDLVWVSGNTKGYNIGNTGVKAYLNAIMVTGEKGNIDPALLSSRPGVDQAFANVPGGTGTPQPAAPAPAQYAAPPVAPAPAQYAAPPAQQVPHIPPAPPAPPVADQFVMTAAANGVTREQYHAAQWTDEQLIANGLMQPPGGVVPSFMG